MDRTLKAESKALESKENRLREIIREAADRRGSGRVIVGFSGGVDSSLLLWEAVEVLGSENVTAVTAVSPTSYPGEEAAAREFARGLNVQHVVIPTSELDDPQFSYNSIDRCYICKHIRYSAIRALAKQQGGAVIFDGSQADDNPSERPGMRALDELGIDKPLLEASMGKIDVRKLLRTAGYTELANKSAQPCLATRIPFGEPITLKALEMIGQGEIFLKECGLEMVRLRHHYPIARIVTDLVGISALLIQDELREIIHRGLKNLGYEYVTLDLEEYDG